MEQQLPTGLPTLSEKLEVWLGFQLPSIPLPKTLKNLDTACARLVGATAEKWASRVDASTSEIKKIAAAKAAMIEASAHDASHDIATSGIVARALAHDLEQKIFKQSNRESITRLAIEKIKSDLDNGSMDANAEIGSDFLNEFSDAASLKSDPEIQTLWAKILAGEIRKPQSFSLQSLKLLSAIDANDAKIIHEILGLTIENTFIFKSEHFNDLINFLKCEELGVLNGVSGVLYRNHFARNIQTEGLSAASLTVLTFTSFRSKISVTFPPNSSGSTELVRIPQFKLTRFGRELLALSPDLQCRPEYDNDFHQYLTQQGGVVTLLEMKTA